MPMTRSVLGSLSAVLSGSEQLCIICGDCVELMARLPEASIDLILTDPPYFGVKRASWDRQWETEGAYLDWFEDLFKHWQRVLKPNGSIYVFVNPELSAEIEVRMKQWFHILNRITWKKGRFDTKAEIFVKENLRSYYPVTERILFAEHRNGGGEYVAEADKVRGFVFEPIRDYLDGERRRAGITKAEVNIACGFSPTPGGMASRHYFSRSQWCLPTKAHYEKMQKLFNSRPNTSPPPYEQFHNAPRTRFESLNGSTRPGFLAADFDELRRPFVLSSQVPYTDVWEFATVKKYPGKHPCEKPGDMISHMLRVSSRPGSVVADFFSGSGVVGAVAAGLGRRAILVDQDPHWANLAAQKLSQLALFS